MKFVMPNDPEIQFGVFRVMLEKVEKAIETGITAIAAKSGTMVWAIASDDTLHYWNGLTWIQSSTETVSGIALANL